MEQRWLREALFAGQTANGFKLGTTLGLGWFWARVNGCRTVYRGGSMETVDFDDVLAVVKTDTEEIRLPRYLSHEAEQIYFYVVRCANRCGQTEQTLRAAVKTAIGNDGKLAKAKPNGVAELRAEQGRDGRIEIVWTYSPIEQESPPEKFRVYCDEGAGEIDYQNAVATLNYRGRRFYRYEVERAENGRYLFAVRAADKTGNENETTHTVAVDVQNKDIEAIEIVNVESI